MLAGSNKSLEDFTYTDTALGALIHSHMLNVSFQAMKGPVSFDKNGDPISYVTVEQIQGRDHDGCLYKHRGAVYFEYCIVYCPYVRIHKGKIRQYLFGFTSLRIVLENRFFYVVKEKLWQNNIFIPLLYISDRKINKTQLMAVFHVILSQHVC